MPFVNTLQSLTSGPLGWVDTAELSVGAQAILDKPFLSEDLLTTESTIVPAVTIPAIAKTLTFTAPVDCTIRNMVFFPIQRSVTILPLGLSEYVLWENAYTMIIGKITVAGSGPDVGSFVDGYGVPCGLFSLINLLTAPRLNLRLDAGDTVSFTIYNGGIVPVAYDGVLTYDLGQDTSVKPTRFIGATAPPGSVIVASVGLTGASGTITVSGATSPGDTIELWGRYLDSSGPSAGGLAGTSGVGGVLTGASGGGGSGTDTWDTDAVGPTAIRDSILAALLDGSNSFGGGWAAVSSGVDSIVVTRQLTGPHGNTDVFVESSTGISLTPSSGNLSGGVAGTGTGSLASPSVNTTVDRIHAMTPGDGHIPGRWHVQPIIFKELRVGGVAEPSFATALHSPESNVILPLRGLVEVPALATLDIDAQGQMGTAIGIYVLSGTAT